MGSALAEQPPSHGGIVRELTYDFIVVGGGSTGSITAARLAQALRPDGSGARFSVLLLEAGGATQAHLGGSDVRKAWKPLLEEDAQQQAQRGDSSSASTLPLPTSFDVPLEWHTVLSLPSLTRRFEWELSHTHADAPRPAIARGLGGCSIHNAMVYIRGLDADFDSDAPSTDAQLANRTAGSKGDKQARTPGWPKQWSFEQVQPFYRRSVSQRDTALSSLPQHAPERLQLEDDAPTATAGGEVHLSSLHPNDIDPFSKHVLQAWSGGGGGSDAASMVAAAATAATNGTALLPLLLDFNDPRRREGVGLYQFLIRDGRRDTAAQELFGTHLQQQEGSESPAAPRPGSLHVRTNVQATRVLFERDPRTGLPRAVGVEVVNFRPGSYATSAADKTGASAVPQGASPLPPHSAPFRLRARYEVILSAGALNTPKLLLLSGIGPADALSAVSTAAGMAAQSSGTGVQIPLVSSLRGVGANLMDGAKALLQFRAHKGQRFRPCMFQEKEQSTHGAEEGEQQQEEHHERVTNQTLKDDRLLHRRRCHAARQQWMHGQREAFKRHQQQQQQQLSASGSSAATSPPPISFGEFGTPGFAVGAFIRSSARQRLPNVQLTLFPFDVALRDWAAAPPGAFDEREDDDEQQQESERSEETDEKSDSNSHSRQRQSSVATVQRGNDIALESGGGGVLTVEIILNNPRSRGFVRLEGQPGPTRKNDSSKSKGAAASTTTAVWQHDASRDGVPAYAQQADPDAATARLAHALLPPVVEMGIYSREADVSDMLDALQAVRKLMRVPTLEEHVGDELLPGVRADEAEMRDYIRCGARQFRARDPHTGKLRCDGAHRVVNHLAGTARMGGERVHVAELWADGGDKQRHTHSHAAAEDVSSDAAEDDGSVVDPFLRVHGVLGLRVADASVMPVLPSGNTAATCMMIGERMAAFLIAEHGATAEAGIEAQGKPGDGQQNTASKHAKQTPPQAAAASSSAPLPASDDIILRDMECPLSPRECHIAPLPHARDSEQILLPHGGTRYRQKPQVTALLEAQQLAERHEKGEGRHESTADPAEQQEASAEEEQESKKAQRAHARAQAAEELRLRLARLARAVSFATISRFPGATPPSPSADHSGEAEKDPQAREDDDDSASADSTAADRTEQKEPPAAARSSSSSTSSDSAPAEGHTADPSSQGAQQRPPSGSASGLVLLLMGIGGLMLIWALLHHLSAAASHEEATRPLLSQSDRARRVKSQRVS